MYELPHELPKDLRPTTPRACLPMGKKKMFTDGRAESPHKKKKHLESYETSKYQESV